MPKQIVPSEFKTHLIDQLIESITEPSSTQYYSFIGDHNAASIEQPTESIADLNVDPYRTMIMGKRITGDDMKFMIRKNLWTSGTVYAIYDDQDADLTDKDYFVSVDEGSFIHTYKCIYNAADGASTSQPTYSDYVSNLAELVEYGDGYVWKYMFSIASVTYNRFFSASYLPVETNSVVEAGTLNGAINNFKVQAGGANYQNYQSGDIDSGSLLSDVEIILSAENVDERLGIAANFYANTIIVMKSGAAVGEFREVISSVEVAGGVKITLDDSFTVDPIGQFELSPKVTLTSDGTQTTDCVARALIDAPTSNSIYKIEILEPGLDYNFATAGIATLIEADINGDIAGTLLEIEDADIRPIIPPPGGHGANAAIELDSTVVGIYQKFSADEGGTTIGTNDFSQYGIIRNPGFANVGISIGGTISGPGWTNGETAYQIKTMPLAGEITSNSAEATISCTVNNNFTSYFSAGDYIYLNDDLNPANHFYGEIVSVPNNDHLTLATNPSFSSANGLLHVTKYISSGIVKDNFEAGKFILLEDVINKMEDGEVLIGGTSGTIGTVTGITTNNKYGIADSTSTDIYAFDVFNQALRIEGAIPDFIEDEVVSQSIGGTAVFAARVHSSNTTHLFLTEVEGKCNTSLSMVGQTSSVTLNSGFTQYPGDIDSTSGTVIYLQNDTPVSRANNQYEEILVLLEF